MSMSIEQLSFELLGLPARSRAILAKQLLASLDDNEPDDPETVMQTVLRRSQEITDGTAETVSAEEVFERMDREMK